MVAKVPEVSFSVFTHLNLDIWSGARLAPLRNYCFFIVRDESWQGSDRDRAIKSDRSGYFFEPSLSRFDIFITYIIIRQQEI
ncbi:MAG: hypothetical protein F6J93_04465 [Oscillatoria sp. SIO1A7]|nr:hypothetical protein [Oscillatoria sp. SIO1A7]